MTTCGTGWRRPSRWPGLHDNREPPSARPGDRCGLGVATSYGPETIAKGDSVRIRGRWYTVVRVNRRTVTPLGSWTCTSPYREIQDHRRLRRQTAGGAAGKSAAGEPAGVVAGTFSRTPAGEITRGQVSWPPVGRNPWPLTSRAGNAGMVAGQAVIGAETVAVGAVGRRELDQFTVRAESEVTRRQPEIRQSGPVHSPAQLFSGRGSADDAGDVVDGQPAMCHRPGSPGSCCQPASTAVADHRMIVPPLLGSVGVYQADDHRIVALWSPWLVIRCRQLVGILIHSATVSNTCSHRYCSGAGSSVG